MRADAGELGTGYDNIVSVLSEVFTDRGVVQIGRMQGSGASQSPVAGHDRRRILLDFVQDDAGQELLHTWSRLGAVPGTRQSQADTIARGFSEYAARSNETRSGIRGHDRDEPSGYAYGDTEPMRGHDRDEPSGYAYGDTEPIRDHGFDVDIDGSVQYRDRSTASSVSVPRNGQYSRALITSIAGRLLGIEPGDTHSRHGGANVGTGNPLGDGGVAVFGTPASGGYTSGGSVPDHTNGDARDRARGSGVPVPASRSGDNHETADTSLVELLGELLRADGDAVIAPTGAVDSSEDEDPTTEKTDEDPKTEGMDEVYVPEGGNPPDYTVLVRDTLASVASKIGAAAMDMIVHIVRSIQASMVDQITKGVRYIDKTSRVVAHKAGEALGSHARSMGNIVGDMVRSGTRSVRDGTKRAAKSARGAAVSRIQRLGNGIKDAVGSGVRSFVQNGWLSWGVLRSYMGKIRDESIRQCLSYVLQPNFTTMLVQRLAVVVTATSVRMRRYSRLLGAYMPGDASDEKLYELARINCRDSFIGIYNEFHSTLVTVAAQTPVVGGKVSTAIACARHLITSGLAQYIDDRDERSNSGSIVVDMASPHHIRIAT